MKNDKINLPPIFIMKDAFGNQHVMISHDIELFPHFKFCSFYYGYGYTDNASIQESAINMAISLGAKEPIHFEHEDIEDSLGKMLQESKIEKEKAQLIINVLACVDNGFREPKENQNQDFHDAIEKIHQIYKDKRETRNREDAMNSAKLSFLTNIVVNQ